MLLSSAILLSKKISWISKKEFIVGIVSWKTPNSIDLYLTLTICYTLEHKIYSNNLYYKRHNVILIWSVLFVILPLRMGICYKKFLEFPKRVYLLVFYLLGMYFIWFLPVLFLILNAIFCLLESINKIRNSLCHQHSEYAMISICYNFDLFWDFPKFL